LIQHNYPLVERLAARILDRSQFNNPEGLTRHDSSGKRPAKTEEELRSVRQRRKSIDHTWEKLSTYLDGRSRQFSMKFEDEYKGEDYRGVSPRRSPAYHLSGFVYWKHETRKITDRAPSWRHPPVAPPPFVFVFKLHRKLSD
jgi:hypothetical protein